jgi:hypothetical protein
MQAVHQYRPIQSDAIIRIDHLVDVVEQELPASC